MAQRSSDADGEAARSGSNGDRVEPIADADDAILEEIFAGSEEWDSIGELVKARSQSYIERYRFKMEVLRLWRVLPGRLQREHRERATELGLPTLLFHGTHRKAVRSILQAGFRLPEHRGMFGRGVYFASCPLKSVQYAKTTRETPDWWYFGGCLAGCVVGSWHGPGTACLAGLLGCAAVTRKDQCLDKVAKRHPRMLLCDVFLGRSKQLFQAKNDANQEDLQRGWLPKALGAKDYDSVHSPSGFAVKVSEYIIYKPHQAIPKYVVEFRTQAARRP